jgi:formylglycine-generating enzyme
MKKMRTALYGLIVLAVMLSACNLPFGSSANPTEEVPVATLELPPTPTIEPSVPVAPTIGSTISWFDTSTLVFVPSGEFTMGADEPRKQDFNPSHTVSLNGFWIYSTKVTNEMYSLCVSLGQCTPAVSMSKEPGETLFGTSLVSYVSVPDENGYAMKDLPATDVTWDQANTYCKWVGGRLPTEAEWEKTARGTKVHAYPWGDEPAACNFLNFKDCAGLLSSVLDHPDGISDYKALDMAGNAYEWVNDWYQKDYYVQSPASNPTGPIDGKKRVVRGSSFDTKSDSVFSARRSSLEPDQAKIDVGFRCVVDNPTIFAPVCNVPAAIPASVIAPQPGQSASENTGSSSDTVTFDISQVPLKVATYCANPSAKIGGATVTWDWTTLMDFGSTHCTSFTYGMVLLDDQGQIYGTKESEISGPKYKNYFGGPPGLTFKLIPILSDCKLKQAPDLPPQGVLASCATGYTLQSNGSCLYTGKIGQPASVSCPGGYSFNSQTHCCTQNPPQAGNQPNQYPACGPGNIYDPQKKICYKPGSKSSTFVPSYVTYQYKLGTCKEPPDTNKPSKPQQPEQTATPSCTDPAGCP